MIKIKEIEFFSSIYSLEIICNLFAKIFQLIGKKGDQRVNQICCSLYLVLQNIETNITQ